MADTNDFKDPTTGKIDWDAYDAQSNKEKIAELVELGFRPRLTQDQVDMVNEPSDAPENYACDGEISPQQAKQGWLRRLAGVGLTPTEIKLARKLNGI